MNRQTMWKRTEIDAEWLCFYVELTAEAAVYQIGRFSSPSCLVLRKTDEKVAGTFLLIDKCF
jgi:hypothetical protein